MNGITENTTNEKRRLLAETLGKTKKTDEIKAAFYDAAGIGYSYVKGDVFGDVLFVFRRDKKLSASRLASVVAQGLYTLRKIRYEETEREMPAYICGVAREEAFICESAPFASFYGKRTDKEYDWDRTPASPCPVLVRDLLSSAPLYGVRVYSLKNEEDGCRSRARYSARPRRTRRYARRTIGRRRYKRRRNKRRIERRRIAGRNGTAVYRLFGQRRKSSHGRGQRIQSGGNGAERRIVRRTCQTQRLVLHLLSRKTTVHIRRIRKGIPPEKKRKRRYRSRTGSGVRADRHAVRLRRGAPARRQRKFL
jgi:hypothetical protein